MKFWKMSGSGNDFVFVDARGNAALAARLRDPAFVREICAPHTGIGADGIAALQESDSQDFTLIYMNRDGSIGELCGNASLCATRLAIDLGAAKPEGLGFETEVGVISARIRGKDPEIDLQPPSDLREDAGIPLVEGETRMGFVNTGVPHLVVLATDVERVALATRGPRLRRHASLSAGANVNWVSPVPGGAWRMRTYERGVEGETLACGTGSVATALLLEAWGLAKPPVRIITTSGRTLTVSVRREASGRVVPSLAGEGRVVFEGVLRDS